jgi:RecA-family ATPase
MKRTLPANLNEVTSQNQLDCPGYGSKSIDILETFDQPPPPQDFVLPSLVAGTVGSIVAPGGAGKSMLALELSILVATGVDLTGFGSAFESVTGKVAFLSAEDSKNATQHRLHAMGKLLSPSQRKQFAQNFEIRQLDGMQIDIAQPGWQSFVEDMATGRRLLIMDTFRRFHGCDENDSKSMAHIMTKLEGIGKRTHCAIVYPHHIVKSAAINSQGDMQQASRGSSVLVDHGRWQMYLSVATKQEAKTLGLAEDEREDFVRIGISKQNYGPRKSKSMWLQRGPGGVLIPANLNIRSLKVASPKKNKEIW